MISKITRVLFIVTILNFGVWGIIDSIIHGDAVNGKIESGKYFVAMKGNYTEVSRSVYLYSYIHTCTNFILFPATILFGLFGTIINSRKVKQD